MKKMIVSLISVILVCLVLFGCTEAERASYNLSQEADNFNDIRYTLNFNPKMWIPVQVGYVD